MLLVSKTNYRARILMGTFREEMASRQVTPVWLNLYQLGAGAV